MIKFGRNVPCIKGFQICSKNSIPCRTLVAMATKRKNFKNLLLKNHKAQSLDIWHVALSSRPLPRLFKLSPLGQYWSRPGGYLISYRLIQLNLKKSSKNKPEGPELRYLACGIVQWTSTKIVQIMAPGSILAPPRGSLVLTQVSIGSLKKIFFSLTVRPRALVFDVKHHLMVL